MTELIIAKLCEYEQDDSVRMVLLEGAGERAFCAGGDIVSLGEMSRDNQVTYSIVSSRVALL